MLMVAVKKLPVSSDEGPWQQFNNRKWSMTTTWCGIGSFSLSVHFKVYYYIHSQKFSARYVELAWVHFCVHHIVGGKMNVPFWGRLGCMHARDNAFMFCVSGKIYEGLRSQSYALFAGWGPNYYLAIHFVPQWIYFYFFKYISNEEWSVYLLYAHIIYRLRTFMYHATG